MIYSIDFETRSRVELKDRGLDVYGNDDSTEVICMAFGVTEYGVQCYGPTDERMKPVLEHVRNGGKIAAWNATFEYVIWNCVCVPKYGWPVLKANQCIDTMAIAAANNVPQNLDDAGMMLDAKFKKDPAGKKLIQKLSKPNKKGVFNEDPELMAQMFQYCIRDVQTEMSISSKLRPLSPSEQAVWELTLRINTRGIPVDPQELENAVAAVSRAQEAIVSECLQLTGCKPTEVAKLLKWLNDRGADMDSLAADSVEKMLRCNNLPGDVKRALQLRQLGSQTSTTKYAKFLEVQRNGRIRNTLVYHGAATGRWASRGGVNMQNIARPTLEDDEIDAAIQPVFYEGRGTMDQLSSLVRSAITLQNSRTFVDVDFSSIENRVGVWIADQTDKVEMFRKGLDEYKVFASESLYHVPYAEVTKEQRQISKSAVLGCMFGQGAKGLVTYAAGMGVNLSLEQSQQSVDNYRGAYPRVKNLWYRCERAGIEAIKAPGTVIMAGTKIKLLCSKGVLWMILPSGRYIAWQRPMVERVMTPWGEEKDGITVYSQNTYTRKWGRNSLIGSSMFQSAVQGTARDMLAEATLRVEAAGHPVINLVHDELLAEADTDRGEAVLKEITQLMTIPPAWASDFPLAAEGWVGHRYRK